MRTHRGFTLIEMLVVIAILAILVSLAVVAVVNGYKSGKVEATRSLVLNLQTSMSLYKERSGDYPPTSLSAFQVRLQNETNNGIEAFTACLASTRKGSMLLHLPTEELYTNVDRDTAGRNVTGWFFGDNQLREISDFFGYTLVYFHHRDYEGPSQSLRRYVFYPGAPVQEALPYRNPRTSTFALPGRGQIISAGPDGIFGTEDDIHSW